MTVLYPEAGGARSRVGLFQFQSTSEHSLATAEHSDLQIVASLMEEQRIYASELLRHGSW